MEKQKWKRHNWGASFLSFGFLFLRLFCFSFPWMKEKQVLVGQSPGLEVLEDWGTCVPFWASLCSQPRGQHLPISPWSEPSSRSPEYMAALASRELVQTVLFTANERKPLVSFTPLASRGFSWGLNSVLLRLCCRLFGKEVTHISLGLDRGSWDSTQARKISQADVKLRTRDVH